MDQSGMGEQAKERVFPNGDIYVGSWQRNQPHGIGKYVWRDGSMYEGEWVRGKKSGEGKMSWPSGATYEGEHLCGCIHGTGTFTGVDGSTYIGQWHINEKSGLGTKMYANGDVYEGWWMHDVPEGAGRYTWSNGNEYVGDWRSGVMNGRGLMVWSYGGKYDGQWRHGRQHGHGVYTWLDGSSYVATWTNALKDAGEGLYVAYSPQCNLPHFNRQDEEDDVKEDTTAPPLPVLSEARCSSSSSPSSLLSSSSYHCSSSSFDDDNSHMNSDFHGHMNGYTSCDSSTASENGLSPDCFHFDASSSDDIVLMDTRALCSDDENGHGPPDDLKMSGWCSSRSSSRIVVVRREHRQGVLINENNGERKDSCWRRDGDACLRRDDLSKMEMKKSVTIKQQKQQQSYDLMLNLQHGIRYTVGKITPEPRRDISPSSDFGPKARVWMTFPKQGSHLTPPHHHSTDFKWKDYCPVVFRHLREMFKIDTADYMLSICGNSGLRELSSPGKSGSIFYISHDDRFMIKTMRKAEVKVLLSMLPSYFNHVQTYENTLITKFFGLHRIKPAGGQKVRFIVMGNMLCTELHIHRRFDLKGSTQGRSADKLEMDENTTLKDLDLDFVFRLPPSWREALLRQIQYDCKFLESQNIMDYSFLLGVHFRPPQSPPAVLSRKHGLILVAHEPDMMKMIQAGSHVRGSPLKAAADEEEIDLLLPGTARLRIQLGVNMPARAVRKKKRDERRGYDDDVVLYFGVIDILQEYDIGKKVEHAYKSLQFDASSISAVDPSLYSRRFQDLIKNTFPE